MFFVDRTPNYHNTRDLYFSMHGKCQSGTILWASITSLHHFLRKKMSKYAPNKNGYRKCVDLRKKQRKTALQKEKRKNTSNKITRPIKRISL